MLQPSKYLDYLNCDLVGPYSTIWRGNWFYFGIQDDVTEIYYAKPIKTKGQAFDIFQKSICQAKHQSGNKLKYLQTNFGGKFANKAFKKYKAKEDIK